DIEACRGASRTFFEAFLQVFAKDPDAVRREEDRQPAICQLSSERHVFWSDRSQVDWEISSPGMDDQLERLSQPGPATNRDVVVLAVMLERPLSLEYRPDDFNIFAGPDQGLAVWNSMPTFDHLGARHSEAESEAPSSKEIQGSGGHSGHGRST